MKELYQYNSSKQKDILELLTFKDGLLDFNDVAEIKECLFYSLDDIRNNRVTKENTYLYGAVPYQALVSNGITDEAIYLLHEPWFSEQFCLNNIVHSIRLKEGGKRSLDDLRSYLRG